MSQETLTSADLVIPDISHIVTEDDTPVDNFQSEKQQRLLVEPLYSSQIVPAPFIAATNVGLFYPLKQPPIVPDAFLSLRVQVPSDWSQKQNRSYFGWEFGKMPEVCIEVIFNREGDELNRKKQLYAQIGVAYYVVFDPLRQLQELHQMNGSLLRVWTLTGGQYVELTTERILNVAQSVWLETVGLGLTLWEGEFEGVEGLWLRWCQQDGRLIPTGKERADQEQRRAEKLAERLRAMDVDPDEV
ncbi:Uma2 family endonuclease [Oscillatoria sp. FACHB-1407]|uniref:Uma2 family endonuclease n=1 Tax=Oscillatoria sp. FACHB-1407 TaxID=2692847 RepID=UPI0016845B79|nr:Uma2 family endonuclease [Oscillatoria sp. FACHB-1407]MBD2460810.1 Uma2 family endonuclease [Oscillatoria sp. FACHB-1407]